MRKLLRAIRRQGPVRTIRSGVLVAFPWEVGYARFLWFTRLGRTPPDCYDRPDGATKELRYSRSYLSHYRPDRRVRWTMFLLASIPDCEKDSLLVIGPRYEPELLMACGLGWRRDAVRGLDTYSYSPMIDVGDMHDLPYGDGTFSAIICGWTLSYSSKPEVAGEEIQRVLRPGGYLVVAVQKVAANDEEVLPEVPRGNDRIQTLDQLDAVFKTLTRVAGFEREVGSGQEGHTIAAYKKPELP